MLQSSPLRNLPKSRQERWKVLSTFIAEWYHALEPGDGYSDVAMQQCAARLGTRLPTALCEWYQTAGLRDDIWQRQDKLLSPTELFCEDGVLHFCVENQSVTGWGVKIADLSQEDPPVLVQDEREEWVVQSPQLSEFVLHLVCYVVQFGGGNAHIHGYAHPSCVERIVNALPSLGFPEFIWTHSRFFGLRDLIVSIDATHHVSASGWCTESLTPFRDLIEARDFEILYETDE
jgi:hypothetical protein